MRISDWSSDVCSSDLPAQVDHHRHLAANLRRQRQTRVDIDVDPRRGAIVDMADHMPRLGRDPADRLMLDRGDTTRNRRQMCGHTPVHLLLESPRSAQPPGGKRGVGTSRSRWAPYDIKQKKNED